MKLLKIIPLILLIGVNTLLADAAKVVYDLTSGDSSKIEKHSIKSIKAVAEYYQKEKKEFKATVVISGDAYKYFVNDLNKSPYADQMDVLAVQPHFKPLLKYLNDEHHVVFNMCSSGMKARKIEKETLYHYVHSDVMKSIYLIEAQNKGYAYIPIH